MLGQSRIRTSITEIDSSGTSIFMGLSGFNKQENTRTWTHTHTHNHFFYLNYFIQVDVSVSAALQATLICITLNINTLFSSIFNKTAYAVISI